MLSRDDFFNRLLYLVPTAKFSFWADEAGADNKGYSNVVIMGGWRVYWDQSNIPALPSLSALQAIDPTLLSADVEAKRKASRDEIKSKDLTTVACYQLAKVANPSLTFSNYLDNLEVLIGS